MFVQRKFILTKHLFETDRAHAEKDPPFVQPKDMLCVLPIAPLYCDPESVGTSKDPVR